MAGVQENAGHRVEERPPRRYQKGAGSQQEGAQQALISAARLQPVLQELDYVFCLPVVDAELVHLLTRLENQCWRAAIHVCHFQLGDSGCHLLYEGLSVRKVPAHLRSLSTP